MLGLHSFKHTKIFAYPITFMNACKQKNIKWLRYLDTRKQRGLATMYTVTLSTVNDYIQLLYSPNNYFMSIIFKCFNPYS